MNSKAFGRKINRAKHKTKKKATAKISTGALVLWVVALFFGALAGVAASFFATTNDTFELHDKKVINIPADIGLYGYKDPGARVIEFGRDISDKVTAISDLEKDADGDYYIIDTEKEGSYYIIYTVDSIRFGKVKRVRTINIEGKG